VDALANPIHVHLSAGNIHDATEAVSALSHISLAETTVLGDKAYGSGAIRTFIEQEGGKYCIPPKSNELHPWECDWWLYKERHAVEWAGIGLPDSEKKDKISL
jgi:transposase